MSSDHDDLDAPGHEEAGGDQNPHDDARDEEPLGPIDRAAWGAGALGVAIGLVIAMCFVLGTSSPV